MARINLVQGDSLPAITLYLTKTLDGSDVNVSDPSINVYVLFRASGTTATLSTITCTKPNGGSDGIVKFDFSNGVLNVNPGAYEGEVVVDYGGGDTETNFDLLKFFVRQR